MVSHGPARKSPFGGMLGPGGAGTMCLPDFPLTSPGNCGARFLRQQGAGATFLGNPAAGRLKVWPYARRSLKAWASR